MSRMNRKKTILNEADAGVYSIGIVAQLVEMHPQTIRHYERIGFLRPSRSPGKMRLYSRRDVETLNRIARFTRDMGINLAGVEVILKLLDEMEELRACMHEPFHYVIPATHVIPAKAGIHYTKIDKQRHSRKTPFQRRNNS